MEWNEPSLLSQLSLASPQPSLQPTTDVQDLKKKKKNTQTTTWEANASLL